MDAGEYKHVVLGLIFLKYISDAFEERHDGLEAEAARRPGGPRQVPPENVFWVPPDARWAELAGHGQAAEIGKIDRPGDGGHREGEPVAQGRAAEGLRPPGSTSTGSAS